MKLIIILVLSSFSLMANSQNDRFDSKVKYEYNVYLEVLNLKLGEASLSVKAPETCLLYTSPSPRDPKTYRMPSSA